MNGEIPYGYFALSVIFISPLIVCEGCSNFTSTHEKAYGNAPSQKADSSYKLVWADEFNESHISHLKWTFEHGLSNDNWPKYWGNNELEYYTSRSKNAKIQNGKLVITARKEDYREMHYTSARLKTAPQHSWLYGKFKARIKLPHGAGIWPAFWMMPGTNSYGPWPKSGEIDIMELIGDKPSIVYGTVHYGNHASRGDKYSLNNGSFYQNYHTFSLQWEPDKIKWLVDGKQYFEVEKKNFPKGEWPFNRQFYIILNLAVGGTWPGSPDKNTEFPQQMKVDYVRVYQK